MLEGACGMRCCPLGLFLFPFLFLWTLGTNTTVDDEIGREVRFEKVGVLGGCRLEG